MVPGVCGSLSVYLASAVLVFGCGTSDVHTASKVDAPASIFDSSVKIVRVPSGSMEPTLPLGARVVVKTGRPTVGAIVVGHPPQGFEIQVCGPSHYVVPAGGAACDRSNGEESEIKTVKRIVAGPGDEIYIRDGHVYRKASGSGSFVRESDSYVKPCKEQSECDFPVAIKIPIGHWFLMGDNRGESDDSRYWGPIPTAWIIGVVVGVREPR